MVVTFFTPPSRAREDVRIDAVVRVLPFVFFIACIALAEPLARLLSSIGLDTRWAYALRAGGAALLLMLFARRYIELAGSLARPAREWGLAVMVGVAVFVLWVGSDALGWGFAARPSFVPLAVDGGFEWEWILLRIAGAALVVPVMEELFWRSFVMRWLDEARFLSFDPLRTSLRALLFSSIAFGFEHDLWVAGIVAGLAYGQLYRSCGHLAPPILAHAVTNALLAGWVVHGRAWHLW